MGKEILTFSDIDHHKKPFFRRSRYWESIVSNKIFSSEKR